MIRFLADENFNSDILKGVRARLSNLDILRGRGGRSSFHIFTFSLFSLSSPPYEGGVSAFLADGVVL
jgi:hypothetical protein